MRPELLELQELQERKVLRGRKVLLALRGPLVQRVLLVLRVPLAPRGLLVPRALKAPLALRGPLEHLLLYVKLARLPGCVWQRWLLPRGSSPHRKRAPPLARISVATVNHGRYETWD